MRQIGHISPSNVLVKAWESGMARAWPANMRPQAKTWTASHCAPLAMKPKESKKES